MIRRKFLAALGGTLGGLFGSKAVAEPKADLQRDNSVSSIKIDDTYIDSPVAGIYLTQCMSDAKASRVDLFSDHGTARRLIETFSNVCLPMLRERVCFCEGHPIDVVCIQSGSFNHSLAIVLACGTTVHSRHIEQLLIYLPRNSKGSCVIELHTRDLYVTFQQRKTGSL